eukprot:188054-Chlamydomonas_euryale.AAC.1
MNSAAQLCARAGPAGGSRLAAPAALAAAPPGLLDPGLAKGRQARPAAALPVSAAARGAASLGGGRCGARRSTVLSTAGEASSALGRSRVCGSGWGMPCALDGGAHAGVHGGACGAHGAVLACGAAAHGRGDAQMQRAVGEPRRKAVVAAAAGRSASGGSRRSGTATHGRAAGRGGRGPARGSGGNSRSSEFSKTDGRGGHRSGARGGQAPLPLRHLQQPTTEGQPPQPHLQRRRQRQGEARPPETAEAAAHRAAADATEARKNPELYSGISQPTNGQPTVGQPTTVATDPTPASPAAAGADGPSVSYEVASGGGFGSGSGGGGSGRVSRHGLVKPEVLAPAGGWAQLVAACEAGADAVYFGLEEFSARA